jgi:hypothetical protein
MMIDYAGISWEFEKSITLDGHLLGKSVIRHVLLGYSDGGSLTDILKGNLS